MSNFPNKTFEGIVYTFPHLASVNFPVLLKVTGSPDVSVQVKVTYGCHCFTEEFDEKFHLDHHRYTHLDELRAFNVERYQCSLQLPHVISSIVNGQIYLADRSYTYVANINLPSASGFQDYSLFFSLEKTRKSKLPSVELYVKSAYLSSLKPASPTNPRNWRFRGLLGEVAGIYLPKKKK